MITCSNCQAPNADNLRFCGNCGTPLQNQTYAPPLYNSVINPAPKKSLFGISLSLIIGFAVFMCVGVLAMCVCFALLARTPSNAGNTSNNPLAPRPVVVSDATVTPEWMAPSYKDMCDESKSLTSVQFEELQKNFIAKKVVDWQGWVYNVRESGATYTVEIGLKNPTGAFLWARDIEINGLAKAMAGNLSLRQKVTFSGTISKISNTISNCNPIYLDHATVTPQ